MSEKDSDGVGNRHGDFLRCSCCGNTVRNLPEENTVYMHNPYPNDTGFGMCVSCGGDSSAPSPSENDSHEEAEAKIRKKMGKALCMFIDARVDVLMQKLNPQNAEKFKAMSYEKKADVVIKLVENGTII